MNKKLQIVSLLFVSIIASGLMTTMSLSSVYAQSTNVSCNTNGDVIVSGGGYTVDSSYNWHGIFLKNLDKPPYYVGAHLEGSASGNIQYTFTYEFLKKFNQDFEYGDQGEVTVKAGRDGVLYQVVETITFTYDCQRDPALLIQSLLDTLQASSIDPAIGSSLKKSIQLLSDTNPNNDKAVCNQLNAFINQVDADVGSGFIDPTIAQNLKSSATNIKTQMQCA